MKRKTIIALCVLGCAVGVVVTLSLFASASSSVAAAPTDDQVLQVLCERVQKAGVEIREAEVSLHRPHLLSLQIAPGDEPAGVAAYRVWRQAALAQMSGLPIEWVEVLAFDDNGEMTYGEGRVIEVFGEHDWISSPTVEAQDAGSQLRANISDSLPADLHFTRMRVSADNDGYRVAEMDVTGDASNLGGEEFRNFITETWVETNALNRQGAQIAVISVKVTDNSGTLQLWDINDLQLGQRAGWHSPTFMPGWIPRPAPAESPVGLEEE
ncbi:MAG: hypothetical protein JXA57_05875 [Armatimonadetes bacterium]|nr:hypothetical protein [Armatimonadota bacterium]